MPLAVRDEPINALLVTHVTAIIIFFYIFCNALWIFMIICELDNIPVITIRAMNFEVESFMGPPDDAILFLSFVEDLRDEPIIIVDARSNWGGNSVLPRKWLHIFTGEIVPQNHAIIGTSSYQTQAEMMADPENWPEEAIQSLEDVITYLPLSPIGDDFTLIYFEDRIVQNDQLLILLVDRFTSSAAESFADALFSMENTLIIGQNTSGTFNFDTMPIPMCLHLSGLQFIYGNLAIIHPEGHLIEGQGIAPDIWVHGDALWAVLRMLEKDKILHEGG
jgi:C-terminal processing protease CtpA/Prc